MPCTFHPRSAVFAKLSGEVVKHQVVMRRAYSLPRRRLGSAASLGGVTANGLGADNAIVGSCDTDGVTTAYTTAYNTTGTAGYKVATVTVAGLNNACDGKAIEVRLTGASNASLETISKTVETDAGSTSTTLTFGSSSLAQSVTGVHIVVSG
jgi:hypothetical protein